MSTSLAGGAGEGGVEDDPARSAPPSPATGPASLRAWSLSVHRDAEVIELDRRFREPPVRFWSCGNERAQAQAVAREVEHLIATGTAPEKICVAIGDPAQRGGAVAAAMEERGIPFHLSGPAALFQRPEVRDAIAWLRVLADPDDSAAAARALTRPPIELRSGDLARLTTISRRRKLDMVAACEAALDSPQIQPEARERIQAFLRLYGAASAALEERRADVFVRRLIERVGLRRQRLFAAQPEVAERLLGALATRRAGLDLGAARATRVHPRLRPLSQRGRRGRGRAGRRRGAALAGSGARPRSKRRQGHGVRTRLRARPRGRRRVGAHRQACARRPRPLSGRARWWRASLPLLRGVAPRRRRGRGGAHEEELFGPAEGLHATYRTLREEVLEASWKAGRELSEPRLDTAVDVNRAIARYLELLKLAALAQRPGDEATAEAIEAVNGLLRQVATARAAGRARRLHARRLPARLRARARPAARADRRPRGALAGGLPASPRRRRAQPLRLRPRPLPDLPAEVQVRARLRHPAGADDQPALRHPRPQRPGALPQGGGRRGRGWAAAPDPPLRGRLAAVRLRLQRRRAPVPRPRARGDAPLLGARERRRGGAGLARAQVRHPHRRAPRARPRRPGRPPSRRRPRADRLQDRRAQERSRPRERPAARPLPPRRARGLGPRRQHWQLLLRARRREGGGADQARRRRAGRAHRACRSARECSARTSSRAPRRRSAAGATTG